MPKIPNMRYGVLLNKKPNKAKIKYIDRIMPRDKKWHTLFEFPGQVCIDGKYIKKENVNSMT